MRFDDRIATVMGLPAANPAARAAKWRQLVDLLAQSRDVEEDGEAADETLDFLRRYRTEIRLQTRQEIAKALGGRAVSPLLLRFFAEDHPSVSAPILGSARLRVGDWLDLLPSLTPTGRALLRHRRDLPIEVENALFSFGPSDFALGSDTDMLELTEAAPAEPEQPEEPAPEQAGEAQIRELVARIDAFRSARQSPPAEVEPSAPATESFRWETGPDGVILWVENVSRGALVGQSIASIAGHGQFGVDGQAAGAFEKRAPFRDARFSIAGNGDASGDWRISGVPFFAEKTGSFLGYRGTARRPRLDEVARAESSLPGLFGTALPADSLRQLIHELRTPLNAIIGFAEMIDGQYMGPAGARYRARAADILDQASRLLSAVDDLDTAARIETRRLTLDDTAADAVSLLCRLHDAYERVAGERNARLSVEIMRDLPPARVEHSTAERMFARMLAATIGLAQEGETIAATLALAQQGGVTSLCLSIDRPRAISGLSETALLDPGYSPDGDWPGAPALGLGFALRLVRNLAEAVGGSLQIGKMRFYLHLPPADDAGQSSEQGR